MNKALGVGLPLTIFGALVMWGGISGNLAAILAALFAPGSLQRVGGSDSSPLSGGTGILGDVGKIIATGGAGAAGVGVSIGEKIASHL